MKFLVVKKSTSIAEVQSFLEQAGPNARIRARGNLLYCREERKGSSLSHVAGFVSGHTQSKREETLKLVEKVFEKQGVVFSAHIRAVLSPTEHAHLYAGDGDLKVEHLLRVFTGKVNVGGESFSYPRLKPFNQGSYGQIYKATGASADKALALKLTLEPVDENDEALRREAAMHVRAYQAAQGGVSYVAPSFEAVQGADGGIYQPMALAICSANALLEKYPASDDAEEVSCLVALTARDWLASLVQLEGIGMAHRDFKPENLLLSKEGVFQLTDFGSAGDAHARFQAIGGKKGSRGVTGNGSVLNKSPEWLLSELPRVEGAYQVGHKADVFALGTAVFRLVHKGLLPFQAPSFDPLKDAFREIDYEEMLLDYAKSGASFCDWYFEQFGKTIPVAWRDFFDASLHSDPEQRASASQLTKLPIIWAPMPQAEADLRAQLLEMAQQREQT